MIIGMWIFLTVTVICATLIKMAQIYTEAEREVNEQEAD